MVLEAKRFSGLEALREGIVDGLGGFEDVVKFVEEMKLVGRGKTGVYGRLKAEMWRETVGYLEGHEGAKVRDGEMKRKEEGLRREQVKRVEEWEKSGKMVAKL